MPPPSAAFLVAALLAVAFTAITGDSGTPGYVLGGAASFALLWRAWKREHGWPVWIGVWAALQFSGLSSLVGPGPVSESGTGAAGWLSWGLYFAATGALILTWGAAARLRGRADTVSTIDGLAIAAACTVPAWVVWIGPALDATDLPSEQVAATLVTPALYLVLIAVATRTLLGGGAWNAPSLLMMLGLAANMVGDVGYNLMALHGDADGAGPTDLGWAVAYACWGAAALHPAAVQTLRRSGRRHGVPANRRALVVVFTAALPLATIAVAHIEAVRVPVLVVLVPLLVMIVLLVVRLAILRRKGARSVRAAALLSSAGVVALLVGLGLTQAQIASDRQRAAANDLLEAYAESEALGYYGARVVARTHAVDPQTVVRLSARTTRVRARIASIPAARQRRAAR